MIKILNLETQAVEHWTIEQVLVEINRDRSGEWTDYDSSDWLEGWSAWVEGEFYSLVKDTSDA